MRLSSSASVVVIVVFVIFLRFVPSARLHHNYVIYHVTIYYSSKKIGLSVINPRPFFSPRLETLALVHNGKCDSLEKRLRANLEISLPFFRRRHQRRTTTQRVASGRRNISQGACALDTGVTDVDAESSLLGFIRANLCSCSSDGRRKEACPDCEEAYVYLEHSSLQITWPSIRIMCTWEYNRLSLGHSRLCSLMRSNWILRYRMGKI